MAYVNVNTKSELRWNPIKRSFTCKPAQIELAEMNTLIVNGTHYERGADLGHGVVQVIPMHNDGLDDFLCEVQCEEIYEEIEPDFYISEISAEEELSCAASF